MTDPFASVPAAEVATSGDAILCEQCGATVSAAAASWSGDGKRICKRCEALETIEDGDTRAAISILGGGLASVSLGLLGLFCINPLALFSVLGFLSGLGALVMVLRHPEYKERMGWRYSATLGSACVGMLLSLLGGAITVLALLGAALLR